MKKNILLSIIILASIGFGLKTLMVSTSNENTELKRVTGIGGIFFKCKNPKLMREWYQVHLGLSTNQYGCVFDGDKGRIVHKRDLHNGVRLTKKQNISSHLRKIS